MAYQLFIDGTKTRTFRRKYEAVFAAKYAIARQGATDAVIYVYRPDGTCIGDFVVTTAEDI